MLGYKPIRAGLAFLPMTLVIVAASQIASRLTNRVGPGPVLAAGMTSIALGMLLFTGVSADGTYLGDVLLASLLCAGGIGFSFVPVTIAATTGVDRSEAGLASGLVNTFRQVGGSIGLALLATVATQRTADVTGSVPPLEALTDGFQRAFAVGAAFGAIGAVTCVALLVLPARRAAASSVSEAG